jgi:hypothetical protein
MATNNGAYYDYADMAPKATFFRSSDRKTKTLTIKSGQVLKALSFVETDANGKAIAHGSLVETALADFDTALTTGQTLILAGLTFTSGSGGTTVAQLVEAWSGIPAGTAAAGINTLQGSKVSAVIGTFTAGTLTGYTTTKISATRVRFDAQGTGAASATDLAATGTGTAPTITITQYAASNKIAGVVVYDVDASAADVDAAVYQEASFWADALVWSVDTTVDTIELSDGTTKAVTAYNTGCAGTDAASNLLKQKFVEGSEFEPLGFIDVGRII